METVEPLKLLLLPVDREAAAEPHSFTSCLWKFLSDDPKATGAVLVTERRETCFVFFCFLLEIPFFCYQWPIMSRALWYNLSWFDHTRRDFCSGSESLCRPLVGKLLFCFVLFCFLFVSVFRPLDVYVIVYCELGRRTRHYGGRTDGRRRSTVLETSRLVDDASSSSSSVLFSFVFLFVCFSSRFVLWEYFTSYRVLKSFFFLFIRKFKKKKKKEKSSRRSFWNAQIQWNNFIHIQPATNNWFISCGK